jgi:AAA domain, putative AbiEii toxin, Type IV TA system/AAA domain
MPMYIEQLVLDNIRTFPSLKLSLIHPELRFRSAKSSAGEPRSLLPQPRLPNVNLLLGDNASGKTTILQAIALAALGPAAPDSRLPIYLLRLRQEEHSSDRKDRPTTGSILADFSMHDQDRVTTSKIQVMQIIERLGELERSVYSSVPFEDWGPIYESRNASFFCVAYGAFRRVEAAEDQMQGERRADTGGFPRRRRVLSVFQDSYPLNRLSNWLPKLRETHHDRYKETIGLLHELLGPGHVRCAEKIKEREYLFERGGALVPFPSLSDGYRGYIGWVGDLLYHMCQACPSGNKLVDLRGIVMVDEIDLLLHPRWQTKVIGTVARTLPRMQFIFTSHSPLVASSLEWMNIYTLKLNTKANRATAKRLKQSIHGLDADQVLISEFFGLSTTRAREKVTKLDALTAKARLGDEEAAKQVIAELASGSEDT